MMGYVGRDVRRGGLEQRGVRGVHEASVEDPGRGVIRIATIIVYTTVSVLCFLQGSLRVAFDAVWSALADEQRAREQELNSAMVSKVRFFFVVVEG